MKNTGNYSAFYIKPLGGPSFCWGYGHSSQVYGFGFRVIGSSDSSGQGLGFRVSARCTSQDHVELWHPVWKDHAHMYTVRVIF